MEEPVWVAFHRWLEERFGGDERRTDVLLRLWSDEPDFDPTLPPYLELCEKLVAMDRFKGER